MVGGKELEDLNLTVHHFRATDVPEGSTQEPSSQELLEVAARLVLSTACKTRWYSPREIDVSIFRLHDRGFQFCYPAPCARVIVIDSPSTQPSVFRLRQWKHDAALSDDEHWALSELEEFDHGFLHGLLASPQLPTTSIARGTTRSATQMGQKRSNDPSILSQPNKRRKSDDVNLRAVFLQPHFLASISTSVPEDSISPLKSSTFFYKNGFSPILPHTRASCESYIQDPFARLAWVVPVRGRFQLEGATPASVHASSPASNIAQPNPSAPGTNGSPDIIWTEDAMKEFWEFLQKLREARNLGPLSLSLSLHVSPSPDAVGSMPQDSYVGSQKLNISLTTPSPSISMVPSHPTSGGALSTGVLPPSSLRVLDHFKLYHDAGYTQSLRSVLNSWSYCMDGQKIRVLKGAKLVLLDERSRGILLC